MPHKRSQMGILKQMLRKKQHLNYALARRILLDYAWRDRVTGEKVFTAEASLVITAKLKDAFQGAAPMHVLNHEYGEVLNRFREGRTT